MADLGWLFAWAKENGIECPNKDGAADIPKLLRLYNESRAKSGGKEYRQNESDEKTAYDSRNDFAGHLAGNVNLSVKALVGIESFAYICKALGKEALAADYEARAAAFAETFKASVGGGVMPLVYGQEGTYALKYNILFDKLFGFDLIGQEVCERETAYYIEKNERYGVPLDTRETYTKADWILWAAALTDDKAKAQALYLPVVRYLAETPTRVPFGDWYYAGRGDIVHFINRSVVGGIFAPLLKASGKMRVK